MGNQGGRKGEIEGGLGVLRVKEMGNQGGRKGGMEGGLGVLRVKGNG